MMTALDPKLFATDAGFPPARWATTQPSPRVAQIKQRLLTTPRWLDVDRARLTTEAHRATEGEPMTLRRAKLLLHLARNMSITIHPDALIVGNCSLLPRMGVIAPAGAVEWVDRALDNLPTRTQAPFNIVPAAIDELRTIIFSYWRGKTLKLLQRPSLGALVSTLKTQS